VTPDLLAGSGHRHAAIELEARELGAGMRAQHEQVTQPRRGHVLDPADYLRWLTDRTDEAFVTSPDDLAARLLSLDKAPDPDGRYRINEFCCRDTTWQATVVELIQRADAVVMDIRDVTGSRHGCEFELQQLSQRLPLRRLVLVIDAATERGVLDAAFGPRLQQVQLIRVERRRHSRVVFRALLEAAA